MSDVETTPAVDDAGSSPTRVLLVDDEERFRTNLAERLRRRGLDVLDVGDGERAIRKVRQGRPDVVVLDLKMPGMDGEQVLREIKRIAPQVQVVILTGHGSIESAREAGHHDAFAYLQKPCEIDELLETIRGAHTEARRALVRMEMEPVQARSVWSWLWGTHGFRPGIMAIGAAVIVGLWLAPTPRSLVEMLDTPKSGDIGTDPIAGYAGYGKMEPGETVAAYYSEALGLSRKVVAGDGTTGKRALTGAEVAGKAQVMVALLVVAALFWATGAIPVGITALLVAMGMYVFGVMPPDKVAQAYAKDAVVFIFGVLALAVGIGKTGLDRRIGLLMLGTSRSVTMYLFLFLPMLALAASFLSEHALVAFIAPILVVVFAAAGRAKGGSADRSLAVVLMLGITFAANLGGPGSPAAGGRNAVMLAILSDYGSAPSFAQWVKMGMPFVPVAVLVLASYLFLRFRRAIRANPVNVAGVVREESRKLGRMTREEILTAGVLVGVIVLWITASGTIGMGGPALIGVVALAALRIVGWRDINKISWEVVALYASAAAIGAGLAYTGAAMWVADGFVALLPEALSSGAGLCIATSLFTGVLTNFMSDGATVSAIGPVAVPMASVSGTDPWMVGLATAFASSFANCLIIGTPNNAIVFALAKDPVTGEQLVTLGDFLKHGLVVTLLSFGVLWGWTILGYWNWIGL